MESPYNGLSVDEWEARTRQLIGEHPLDADELYQIVVQVWGSIFQSSIGSKPYKIGRDLFPRPQIMAFFLHELVPLQLLNRYPDRWRREQTADEKDLVHIPDRRYSIEIKTSSSKRRIYGNRSYTQPSEVARKSKSGYYLAINFQKFSHQVQNPQVTLVRFGWIDHEDWLGQAAATGQQARLSREVEQYKLLQLPFLE